MAKAVHSFRSGRSQAKQLAAEMAAHGTSRHEAKSTGASGVQGIGTERIGKQIMSHYGAWLHQERRGDLHTAGRQAAIDYLEQRAEAVRQSTLDQARQALDRLHHHLHGAAAAALPHIKSELETVRSGRAYSLAQLEAIKGAMSAKNAICVDLSERASLRAHEMFTLQRAADQPRSSHRQWNNDRFIGANGQRPDGELYTVIGKGGLCREVFIPRDLVERLEAFRLPTPERITDRGVHYHRRYGLGGGQAFSQAFSAASKRVLGFSTGAHSCRHGFAQRRLAVLCQSGLSYRDARLALTQEMGHFRERGVIDAYLR